ncbi:hypothetical protein AVEN_178862-1 [Araneus ventricosus]|uniref:Uncharacterized protein n=1 Tax=Araneus ventricosus TaxID=182803 RepID=A0A4Y2BGB0_ARAVE|nr:hypothetical protein AVEN_178862-1 [Araneus ventricosus]
MYIRGWIQKKFTKDQLVSTGLTEITSCPLSQFSGAVFTPLSEVNLVPDKCSFNFGKRKESSGHREVIRRKRTGMLSDDVILLHVNTHTACKTQELLRSSSGKSGATPLLPDSAPNLGSQHLSGTRFSSESDVKIVVEN